MATNDRVDAAKVSKDFNSVTDQGSLQNAMDHLTVLQKQEGASATKPTEAFQADLAQINQSVDMKKLNLDGFQITNYAHDLPAQDSNGKPTPTQLLEFVDPSSAGKDHYYLDNQGEIYAVNQKQQIEDKKLNIFTGATQAADNSSTKPDKAATPGAQVADNNPPNDAPAPAPAAGSDNSFGTHGRKFDVGDDGKPSYSAAHGDTYWSVAKDLLSKDGNAPTNTDIANEVNKLAKLNGKDDPNKLMVGEKIALPPELLPAPAAPADKAPAAPADKAPAAPADKAPAAPADKAPAAPADKAPAAPADKAPAAPADKAPAAPADKAPAAPAAVTGLSMKDDLTKILPEHHPENSSGDVYSPLSPMGMAGADLDKTQADPYGDAKAPVTKDGLTTQETDMYLKDGHTWWNLGATYVKNVDVKQGDVLKQRTTTYNGDGVDMNFQSVGDVPKKITGVTKVESVLQADGSYSTRVTADGKDQFFKTDSHGNLQMASDGVTPQFAVAPTKEQMAALDTPATTTAVAANVEPASDAAPAPVVKPVPGPVVASADADPSDTP